MPAIARVEGEPFYMDKQGSLVGYDKLSRHMELILPLRTFVAEASKWADGPNTEDHECALAMMNAWADGCAMTAKPANFSGVREQQRFAIALNIIALKLQNAGCGIDPLLPWLRVLNRAVIGAFDRRDRTDNLYIWSAVNAASYAVLSDDARARAFQDKVWGRGIAAIGPDGYIDSERRRAARALSYHAYFLSALLTLNVFRQALGYQLDDRERAAIECLANRIALAYDDPAEIVLLAGGHPQHETRAIQFAPIVAFAGDLAKPLTRRLCGIPADDPILGGDLYKAAAILTDRAMGR
jgi:poly(beta-D-mannuronate) lyase